MNFSIASRGIDRRVFPERGGDCFVFDSLPELEADADSSNYVVNFDNAASGDVTGVGAGLTGADLVFTQYGGVPAASGGWCDYSANQGFKATATWFDTFLRNASGFSVLWHMRNASTTNNYLTWAKGSPNSWYLGSLRNYAYYQISNTYASSDMFGGKSTNQGNNGADAIFPSASEFWILYSFDFTNNLGFMGVSQGADQPTQSSTFKTIWFNNNDQSPLSSAVVISDAFILGYSTSGIAAGVKSVTARKGPSVSLVT